MWHHTGRQVLQNNQAMWPNAYIGPVLDTWTAEGQFPIFSLTISIHVLRPSDAYMRQ